MDNIYYCINIYINLTDYYYSAFIKTVLILNYLLKTLDNYLNYNI